MRASLRRLSRLSSGADPAEAPSARNEDDEDQEGDGAGDELEDAPAPVLDEDAGEDAGEAQPPEPGSANQRLSQRLSRRLSRTRRWLLGPARPSEAAAMRADEALKEVSWQCLSVAAIRDTWEAVENESLAPKTKLTLSGESEVSMSVVRIGTKRRVNMSGEYEPREVANSSGFMGLFGSTVRNADSVRGTNPRFPRKVFTHNRADCTQLQRVDWRLRDVVDHVLVPFEIDSGLPTVERLEDGTSGPEDGILVLADAGLRCETFVRALQRYCARTDQDPAGVFVWHLDFCVHHTSTGLPEGKDLDTTRAKRFFKEELPQAVEKFDKIVVVLDERLNGLRQAQVVFALHLAGEKGKDVELIWPGQGESDFSEISSFVLGPYNWISVFRNPNLELGLLFNGFILGFRRGDNVLAEAVRELGEDTEATVKSVIKNVQTVLSKSITLALSDFAEKCIREKSIANTLSLLEVLRIFVAVNGFDAVLDLGERTLALVRESIDIEEGDNGDETAAARQFQTSQVNILTAIGDALVGQKKREEAAARFEEALEIARERASTDFRLQGQVVRKASSNLREMDGRREDGLRLAETFVDEMREKADVVALRDATVGILEDVGYAANSQGDFERGVRTWSTLKRICADYERETGGTDYTLYNTRYQLFAAMAEASSGVDLLAEAEEQTEAMGQSSFFGGWGGGAAWSLANTLALRARIPNYSLELYDFMGQSGQAHMLMSAARMSLMASNLITLGRFREATKAIALLEEEVSSSLNSGSPFSAHMRRSPDTWAHVTVSAYRTGDTDGALAQGRAYIEQMKSQVPYGPGIEPPLDPDMDRNVNRARTTLLRILLQTYDVEAARPVFKAYEKYVRQEVKNLRKSSLAVNHRTLVTDLEQSVWIFRGSIARCEGKPEKALDCFRKADDLARSIHGPKNLARLEARYSVFHALLDLGRVDEAEEVLATIPRPDEEKQAYYHKGQDEQAQDQSTPAASDPFSDALGEAGATRFLAVGDDDENGESGLAEDAVEDGEEDEGGANGDDDADDRGGEEENEAQNEEGENDDDNADDDGEEEPEAEAAVTTANNRGILWWNTPYGGPQAGDNAPGEYSGPLVCEPLHEESARRVGPWSHVIVAEARLAFHHGDLDGYVQAMHDLGEAQKEINGEEFTISLITQVNYAAALQYVDAYEEAREVLERVLEVARGMKSPDPLIMAEILGESAKVHAELGESTLAVKESAEALLLIRERAPLSSRYGYSLLSRAAALHAARRTDEAEDLAEQGLNLLAEIFGFESGPAGKALLLLAEITEDEAFATEYLRVCEVAHGQAHPLTKRAALLVDALRERS